MVDSAGEWDWRILQDRLPQHILLRLAAMHRPQQSFHMDYVEWGLRDDRRFSIKSAYQFQQWFRLNLRQQGDFVREPKDWDMLFPAVLWNLWKQRNDRVFNGVTEEWRSVVTRSKWLADSSTAAAATLRVAHASSRVTPVAAATLRISHTSSSVTHAAAATLRVLHTSSSGTSAAVDPGSCADALRLIEQRTKGGGPFTLVHQIHVLRELDWRLVFSKVGRGSNDVADRLAKLSSYASLDTKFFDDSPL
ncbi:hypothetical protein V6N12_016253 [Hibiscus sabdariffa]|uniref:RNase H type-1 domain-containing protein n=1 Tax=Hibiscus sabdariffa TaxID=183260 RepID=A0ABR2CD14_9ROSI